LIHPNGSEVTTPGSIGNEKKNQNPDKGRKLGLYATRVIIEIYCDSAAVKESIVTVIAITINYCL